MVISRLTIQNFRNFREKTFDFPDSCIVFEGNNGIGKTSVLEAIYFLCTGKSQRRSRRTECINFEADFCYLEGEFHLKNSVVQQVSMGFGKDHQQNFCIDRSPSNNFVEWFSHRPVVSLCPEDSMLIFGPPENRRKFVDLFCSHFDRTYLEQLLNYRFWLKKKTPFCRAISM
jgi:DNA replication and repair protein RecF